MSDEPPQKNKICFGIDLKEYKLPLQGGINLNWLIELYQAFPDKAHYFNSYFTKLVGNKQLQQQIEEGKSEKEIKASWAQALDGFKAIRNKYLLYP